MSAEVWGIFLVFCGGIITGRIIERIKIEFVKNREQKPPKL